MMVYIVESPLRWCHRELCVQLLSGFRIMSFKTKYHPTSSEYWKKAWECKDTVWHVDQIDRDTAGVFDAIWDRGGIVAIDPTQVAKYLKLIESLMAPGCQYVVQQMIYNIPGRSGPPYYVSLEQLQNIFGSQFNFEVLANFPSPYCQKVFNTASLSLEVIKTTKK
ncbi:hypothetical protein LSH36_1141g00012 [Paralvinella palmiformis]|uniref:Thiopurine S-methyltransferase n=1 Tax=Paralvinella palmiformis TaxID=53620 RepID=A0AAD9IV86_9ANNE|nr:hypothetical protein LSH36_1141g00012 [Paralvinella palmiformis]